MKTKVGKSDGKDKCEINEIGNRKAIYKQMKITKSGSLNRPIK